MNNDNFKGTAKKVEGAIESTYGNATNNASAQIKGEGKKLAGEAQNLMGQAEDKVVALADKARDFISHAREDFSSATTRVSDEINSKPVRSSAIALGVGFVLGVLLAR